MDNSDEDFDALTTPTTLTFGKHKGRSIAYMIENHPSYMAWVVENEVMELTEDIIAEIEDANSEDLSVEY